MLPRISSSRMTVVNPSIALPEKYRTSVWIPIMTANTKTRTPAPVTSCIGTAEKREVGIHEGVAGINGAGGGYVGVLEAAPAGLESLGILQSLGEIIGSTPEHEADIIFTVELIQESRGGYKTAPT